MGRSGRLDGWGCERGWGVVGWQDGALRCTGLGRERVVRVVLGGGGLKGMMWNGFLLADRNR